MKTKTFAMPACAVCTALFITCHAFAQQTRQVLPSNASQKEITLPSDALAKYTFKVYNAPNNTFGYDILKNGKPVYHQFILTALTHEGKRLYATKPQVEKTASLAIEKIKNGRAPEFSNEELLKILSL